MEEGDLSSLDSFLRDPRPFFGSSPDPKGSSSVRPDLGPKRRKELK